MASIDGNREALGAEIDLALKRFGLAGTPWKPFLKPFWIPDQPGLPLGTRVDVYRNLPRNPDAAIVCVLGQTYFSLTLDPVWTTPQAMIAISFDSPSSATQPVFLTPGYTVRVPNGFDRFWVWSFDSVWFASFAPAGLLGYVRFLLGPSLLDVPNFVGMKPHPAARILSAQAVNVGLVNAYWIPTNVPRVRAVFRGVTAANVYSRTAFSTGATHFSYDRDAASDVALNETPDNVVVPVNIGVQRRFTVSSYGIAQGAVDVCSAVLRSMPGLVNGVITSMVPNDPTGVVTKGSWLIEAMDAGEIERETFEDLVLYDFTTPANTALDTGIVPVYGMRQVHFLWTWSAGLAAGVVSQTFEVDDGGVSHIVGGAAIGAAGVTEANYGWGPGCTYQLNATATSPIPAALPNRIRLNLAAAGAAITTRLRIIGVPK